MKKLALTFYFFLAISSPPGFSLTDGSVLLEGKVKSFDQSVVKLVSGSKAVIVPRRLVLISDLKVNLMVKVEIPKSEVSAIKYAK